MPELPEVESYRRLAEGALGRTVTSVRAPDAWYLKGGTTAPVVRRALVGSRFTAARRIGKLLLVDLAGPGAGGGGRRDGGTPPTLGIRFGMTGTLVVDGSRGVDQLLYTSTRRERAWERFAVGFGDGGSLVVHDPRRLGGVFLDPDTSALGPDATVVTPAELRRALSGGGALKAALLDQSKVAGIGNLIADELLWRAGLSPVRAASSLTPAELRRLHRHLVGTLGDVMARGGSHLGDVVDERHVGGRCPKDGTELVRATVGGRTTWWCPGHQG